ncbi:MAG: hypothetical protein V4654_00150 [Bdellovibrionota bacterium]
MKRNLILSLVAILGITFLAQISFARQPTTGTLDEAAKRASDLRKYRELQKQKKYQERQQQIAAPQELPDVDDPAVVKSPFKFTTAVSLSYEQSAEENSSGGRSRGLGLAIVPKFVFWNFSIRADLFYGYDLNAPSTASGMADGVFSLLYDGVKLSALKFSPYTSVELPLSKESRENREIELVNNVGVLVSLDTKALDVEKLSMSYSVAYGYYTNKYTTRVNGEPATEYKIVQTFKAGYDFNPISIAAKFQFTSAYSYEDVVRSGFLLVESISYEVNDLLGFSLYHYNRAALLKETTYENNLQAYDKETSTVGLSMDLSL